MTKDNSFLAGTILAGALIIAGSLIYVFGPEKSAGPPEADTSTITLPSFETSLPYSQTPTPGGDILLGDPNAPVEIVIYSDYQCPFCARFFLNDESKVREDYVASGKANLIYKDLAFLGEESTNAALAANCAADQGKFWEYHDALFTVETLDNKENSGNLNKDLFLAIADKLGMDKSAFESCFDSKKYAGEVDSDMAEAQNDLSKLSTPSTLVNGELVQGAVPYEALAGVIDKYLK